MGSKGLELDFVEAKTIKEWKIPTIVKEIRSFLDLAAYISTVYQAFCQGSSTIDRFDIQRRPLPLVFKGGGGLQRIEEIDDDRSCISVGRSKFGVYSYMRCK